MMPIYSTASARNRPALLITAAKRRRRAFSLLELLIVIMIISLVYSLSFSYMQKQEKKPKALGPENLKTVLGEQGLSHSDAEFFCIDNCSRCFIYKDGDTKEYEGRLSLGNISVYIMGEDDALRKVKYGRFRDRPVCLRFRLHHNGSSTRMVVKNAGGIYYLPSLFGKTLKVSTLDDAKTAWLKHTDTLRDSGEYYR
jgi:prepilin-type N-terminal cleavage/methylation domain-containing protein